MELGVSGVDSSKISLPQEDLLRHVSILGNTGSGKTVMAKIILEECILAGIPAIVIDVQGDLARLAMDPEPSENLDKAKIKIWKKKSEVRIWTPTEDAGLPVSLDPFRLPSPELEENEAIPAWDRLASGIVGILGYDLTKPKDSKIKSFLYRLLINSAENNNVPKDFGHLGTILGDLDPENYDDLVDPNTIKELERRANSLDSGVQNRLYTYGSPLNIPMMTKSRTKNKTPLNILYLNSLSDESMKMAFIQQFCRELYDWMLTNPSQKPQLVIFLDEAAPYIPSGARMPPTKSAIRQHLQQGRKFGVCWILASQSPKQLDYQIFGQTNTLFLGRFQATQDKNEVRKILKEMNTNESISDDISGFNPGEFILTKSGQESGETQRFKSRWLLTSHGSPLTTQELHPLTDDSTRKWANTFSNKNNVKVKVSKSVSKSAESTKKSVGKNSSVKSDTLGGFTHFADKSDPMHVMMGATNAITSLTLIYCSLILGEEWNKGEISQIPFTISILVSVLMIFGILMGLFLKNESDLSVKIRKKARILEALVLLWIWILWYFDFSSNIDLHGASYPIVISQTLLTAFFGIEIAHRVQLGKLQYEGENLVEKIQSSVTGLPMILTQAEIVKLELTSNQIFDKFRDLLDYSALLLLFIIFYDPSIVESSTMQEFMVRVICLSVVVQLSKWVARKNGGLNV